MKKSILTERQLAALDCARNIAVTAGAGTGKTFILVERYLDLLIRRDVDIREILAITFTKKAAAEMKTRVAERIEALLGDAPEPRTRVRLIQIRDYLSAAYISTIHSFCARILREYPVEAGIDPEFTQLSDLQYETLFEETLGEIIGELDQEQTGWLELFRSVKLWSIEEMLRAALAHRFELRPVLDRYQNEPPEILFQQLIRTYLLDVQERIDTRQTAQILRQVDLILGNLINRDPEQPEIKALLNFKQSADPGKIEFWQALISLQAVFTTGQKTAYSNLRYLGGRELWGEQNASNVLYLSGLLAAIGELPEAAPASSDLRRLQLMAKFFELYRRFEERFRQKKQIFNAVDYEDLQLLVYDLLKSDDRLRRNIAERFRYVMVDEFQDTNPLQWAIISLLGELRDHKFFIVGDPKQSIYGFRNADVRVFQNVKQRFISDAPGEEALTDIILEESFRFKERLAGFINYLFAGIMEHNPEIAWEVGYDQMSCKREDADGGEVEIALLDDRQQPGFIASAIRELEGRNGTAYGDMAILLRTRNHLTEVEETLRQNGIPFKTIGGIGFFQRQEIYDVYHLIRFLISPADDVAVVGLLRSPFADISDTGILMLSRIREPAGYWEKVLHADEAGGIPADDWKKMHRFRELAQKWLYRRDRMSFNELLDSIFNHSGFRAIYAADHKAARYLANLDKILEQAVELERGGFTSLADFGEALQNLIRSQIQESEAPVEIEDKTTVKIMTIHQAKGLEFPVIFIPYLEQKLRSAAFDHALFDEEYGFAPVLTDEAQTGMLPRMVRQRAHRKALAELKRLFYVGCTRARDRLVLLGTVDNGKVPAETPLAWLQEIFGPDLEHPADQLRALGVRISRKGPEQAETPRPVADATLRNVAYLKQEISRKIQPGNEPGYLMALEDQPEGEVFSATQLMMYAQHPVDYFARYHLGYFESDYDFSLRLATDEDTALLLGKLIHSYFEEYPDFDLNRTLSEYEVTDPDIIGRLRRRVEETIDRIKKSERISEILAASESRNEVSILRKTGNDLLTGTIDRMFRNRDGFWEIIDYKTNRIPTDEVAGATQKYRLQLDVYALLLAGLYPQQEYYRVNLYFTQIDILQPEIYRPDDLRACEIKIQAIINGIKSLPPYRAAGSVPNDLHLNNIRDKF